MTCCLHWWHPRLLPAWPKCLGPAAHPDSAVTQLSPIFHGQNSAGLPLLFLFCYYKSIWPSLTAKLAPKCLLGPLTSVHPHFHPTQSFARITTTASCLVSLFLFLSRCPFCYPFSTQQSRDLSQTEIWSHHSPTYKYFNDYPLPIKESSEAIFDLYFLTPCLSHFTTPSICSSFNTLGSLLP